MAKYIDADRLKAEIKRQIHMEELNFAALGGGGQTFCINTLEWVLKQIDSQPEERPSKDLETEIATWIQSHLEIKNEQFEIYREPMTKWAEAIARHFYELGQQSKSPASKNLEQASEEYRRESFKKSVMPQIDGPANEYGGSIKDAFIAGAQWQTKQMMKEAIEGEISLINVGDDSYVKTLRMSELRKVIQNRNLCCGKVKVIIIKDDERED